MARPKSKRNCRGLFTKKIKVGTSITGESIYKVFSSKESKAAAEKKAQDYLIQQALEESSGLVSENVKFRQIAEIVLSLKKGTIKEETWRWSWKSHLDKHINPYFGDVPIRNIRKNDIEMYFKKQGKQFSLETLRKHRQIISAVFENALENGYINHDPCRGLKVKEGSKPRERYYYTKEQCDLILQYTHMHRHGFEVYIMITCGLSRSELLGLTWDCINFKEKYIHVKQAATLQTGKGVIISDTKNKYRNRKVVISDETIRMLEEHKDDCNFLVHTRRGTPIRPDTWVLRHFNIFMRDMQSYYQEQGIDIPLYTAHETGRHTLASLFMNAGVNITAITHQMGWANSDMLLERYGHDDIQERRKLLESKKINQAVI